MVTLVVYGYEQYNVPSDFQPILVPQFLITEDDDTPKFGVGKNIIYINLLACHNSNKIYAETQHYVVTSKKETGMRVLLKFWTRFSSNG